MWFRTHAWSPEQFGQVVEATLPDLSTRRVGGQHGTWVAEPAAVLRLAAKLSAEPQLARSLREPLERYRAMKAEDWEPPRRRHIVAKV
jgi:hypothetical protein